MINSLLEMWHPLHSITVDGITKNYGVTIEHASPIILYGATMT